MSKKANLAHVRYTYQLAPQTEDRDIYNLATKEDRMLVTQDHDFKSLIKTRNAGVILIPSYLTNDEIDRLLGAFVGGKNPDEFRGKVTRL